MAAVIQTGAVSSINNDSQVLANSNDKNADIKIADVESKQDGQTVFKDLLSKIKPSSFGQRRNYSRIDISAEKWLMAYDEASLAKLENPPSLADGISMELEKDIRYLGCELIQSGAILLKLSQTAAATAQILFQRFYYQKSFVRHNFEVFNINTKTPLYLFPQHMVCACLLLASKIEEQPRKPREVINVYHRLKQLHQHRRKISGSGDCSSVSLQQLRPKKFDHLELGGSKYMDMKNNVIKSERRLLNVLGFVVHVHHPHKLIYIYLHILGLLRKESDPNATKEQINRSKELLQKAWYLSYMNDGLRTDMFLRYTPETIACACIQLAAKTVEHPVILPKSPFPWFELFDASDRDIRLISQMLMCLYTRTTAPSLDFIHSQLEKHQKRLSDSDKAKELADKAKAYADIQEAIKTVTSNATTKSTSSVQTKKDDDKAVKVKEAKEAPRISKNNARNTLGPPFHVMVDTSFVSYSIKNRLDIMKGFRDCLFDKVIPYIPDCVVVELEKQERRFKSVLKIINDHRFQKLHCPHKKGIYPDECIVQRIKQHNNYIVATCDRDLRKRIRKIPDVPIMYIRDHRYIIERMPG
uniref:CYCLIN domain-containing protein n=1 Tax=Meloidogyne hapla TaxID=6305 RepID=A0A1I8BNX0_MELHA